jgi:hypothetical protein
MGMDDGSTNHVPVRWLIVTSLLIGIAVAIGWLSTEAPRGLALVKNFPEFLNDLQNDEQKRIGFIIFDSYNEYRAAARNWSGVTFGSLFLSAALSACGGVILKLEFFLRNEPLKKDLAAVMAVLAALLITVSTVGGFHDRWAANRLATAKMESLAYSFISAGSKPDLTSFSDQIQSIAFERNEKIVSNPPTTTNPPPPKSEHQTK